METKDIDNNSCIKCFGSGLIQPPYLDGEYEECSDCKGTGKDLSIYPLSKIKVNFEVIEDSEGKHYVSMDMVEKDTTMKDIALLLYNLKKFEQELLDREWDSDGYEILEGNNLDTK